MRELRLRAVGKVTKVPEFLIQKPVLSPHHHLNAAGLFQFLGK